MKPIKLENPLIKHLANSGSLVLHPQSLNKTSGGSYGGWRADNKTYSKIQDAETAKFMTQLLGLIESQDQVKTVCSWFASNASGRALLNKEMFRKYFCRFQYFNGSIPASAIRQAMEMYSGVLFTQQAFIVMADNQSTLCEIFIPELAPVAGMNSTAVQRFLCPPVSRLNGTSTPPGPSPTSLGVHPGRGKDREQDG